MAVRSSVTRTSRPAERSEAPAPAGGEGRSETGARQRPISDEFTTPAAPPSQPGTRPRPLQRARVRARRRRPAGRPLARRRRPRRSAPRRTRGTLHRVRRQGCLGLRPGRSRERRAVGAAALRRPRSRSHRRRAERRLRRDPRPVRQRADRQPRAVQRGDRGEGGGVVAPLAALPAGRRLDGALRARLHTVRPRAAPGGLSPPAPLLGDRPRRAVDVDLARQGRRGDGPRRGG